MRIATEKVGKSELTATGLLTTNLSSDSVHAKVANAYCLDAVLPWELETIVRAF